MLSGFNSNILHQNSMEKQIFCSWKSYIGARDVISSQSDLQYKGHRQTIKTTCKNSGINCSHEPFLRTHFLRPKWPEIKCHKGGDTDHWRLLKSQRETTRRSLNRSEIYKPHSGQAFRALSQFTGYKEETGACFVTKEIPREKRKSTD